MTRFRWTRARVAGAAGGALLAGGVLLAGGAALGSGSVASAQSPSPSPSPSARPGMPRTGGSDFAQRLAQALGIPQARVEDALRQQRDQHRAEAEARRTQHHAQAASTLGVTPQQLTDAITAARQSVFGSTQPGGRSGQGQGQSGQSGQGQPPPRMGGPGMGRPNSDAFHQAVAQNLGRGITAEQVRDALRHDRTGVARPDRTQIEQRMNERLQQLAALLGVTPEQLRTALQSIGADRGPGRPFGPRGR